MTIHESINEQPEQRTDVEIAADKFDAAQSFFDAHAQKAPPSIELAMGGALDALAWEVIETPASRFYDLQRKIQVIDANGLIDIVGQPGKDRRLADAIRGDLDRLYPAS